jgi:hypothetical protein
MADLVLPKSRVPVEIALPRGRISAEVFIADYARNHAGPERVADVLNGEESFFAAAQDKQVRFIARDAVLWAKVPLWAHEDPQEAGEPVRLAVEIELSDGARLAGEVRFLAPGGRTRLKDYLNDVRGFFPLFQPEAVFLVNRAHAASVTAAAPTR